MAVDLRVVALAGGVGGAKLATGLQEVLPPDSLTVIVNTGDDFEHWGLTICPDLDTVMYNLAGMQNPQTGWGQAEDTFAVLGAMELLGGEDWFRLGDCDLAVHLRRTEWLQQGVTLSEVTDRLRRALGIPSAILPMSDSPVRTLVHTDEGDLPFQHYFVRRRCEPSVMDLTFVGAADARLPDAAEDALRRADIIVLCPSNPYLSIDPILSVGSMRQLLRKVAAPKVAVAPIVGGQALKGPAAKMMQEMGLEVSPLTVAFHYADFLSGFMIDQVDADLGRKLELPTQAADTIMTDRASKARLAESVLAFVRTLLARHRQPLADLILPALAAMSLWLLIPVKPFGQAKSRLAAVLSPAERLRLMRTLVTRTLHTAQAANRFEGILVISRDAAARDLAHVHGAVAIDETGEDLNQALDQAVTRVAAAGATAVLILPVDLPLITVEDIRLICALGHDGADVVLAPSRDGGTNALFLRLPTQVQFVYGPGSFAQHRAQAQAAQYTLSIYESPSVVLDLDRPDDYLALSALQMMG